MRLLCFISFRAESSLARRMLCRPSGVQSQGRKGTASGGKASFHRVAVPSCPDLAGQNPARPAAPHYGFFIKFPRLFKSRRVEGRAPSRPQARNVPLTADIRVSKDSHQRFSSKILDQVKNISCFFDFASASHGANIIFFSDKTNKVCEVFNIL